MDTLTHGILGGAAAYAACGGRTPWAALIGVAAGMAPDLDLFIRPDGDPLGGLSYHRHFTHALVLVPLGAALCALPFLPWRALAGNFWWLLLASLVAYATHPVLDALTSYGTVLGWPFSRARVALDTISIIDPLFTVVVLVGLVWGLVARQPAVARWALAVGAVYLMLGGVQHYRGLRVQRELARLRGHELVRGRVMPTLGNLLIWNSVYEADGRLYTDSVRLPVVGEATVRVGSSGPRVTLEMLRERGYDSPAVAEAFEQFDWFADGYAAFDPRSERLIGDMRYSADPEEFVALWGLKLPEKRGSSQSEGFSEGGFSGGGFSGGDVSGGGVSGSGVSGGGVSGSGVSDGVEARFVSLYGGDTRRNGLRRTWEALLGRDPLFRPVWEVTSAGAG